MPDADTAGRQRADKLAQTIIFTSQGTPFIFAGEEIFRDKKGVHNSYKSPDSINAIDWTLKSENGDIYNYYRELIALRKGHPAFRMTTADDVARHLVFDDVKGEPNLISYSLKDYANGDSWKEIKVVFNGSEETKKVKIGRGEWLVVARDGQLKSDGMGHIKGGNIEVAPCSALILAKEK